MKMGDPANPGAPPENSAAGDFTGSQAEQYAATLPPPLQAPPPPLATQPQPAPRPEPPRRIGRFVVLRHLGQGGMGVVYSAYDEELDRKLAVKLLHQSELASADRRTRIFREAQAMARVSHPNVVQVYEVGEVDGQVFIAMEFIEGTTLGTWQKQGERSWDEVLRMYLEAGQGLLAAHRVGLVHRDFKPEHIAPPRRRVIPSAPRHAAAGGAADAI